jgi:hypothetical protein
MSIKSIKLQNKIPNDSQAMELRLRGSGATTVGLFDAKGNLLMTKRWRISGPSGIEVRSRLPLYLRTKGVQLPVIPVLIYQTNAAQAVTFNGHEPASTTAERCRTIKVTKAALSKIHTAIRVAAASSQDDRVTLPRGTV